jgi:hypothetical protein
MGFSLNQLLVNYIEGIANNPTKMNQFTWSIFWDVIEEEAGILE